MVEYSLALEIKLSNGKTTDPSEPIKCLDEEIYYSVIGQRFI